MTSYRGYSMGRAWFFAIVLLNVTAIGLFLFLRFAGTLIVRPGDYRSPTQPVVARVQIVDHILHVSLLSDSGAHLIDVVSGNDYNRWSCEWSEDGRAFWIWSSDIGDCVIAIDANGNWRKMDHAASTSGKRPRRSKSTFRNRFVDNTGFRASTSGFRPTGLGLFLKRDF